MKKLMIILTLSAIVAVAHGQPPGEGFHDGTGVVGTTTNEDLIIECSGSGTESTTLRIDNNSTGTGTATLILDNANVSFLGTSHISTELYVADNTQIGPWADAPGNNCDNEADLNFEVFGQADFNIFNARTFWVHGYGVDYDNAGGIDCDPITLFAIHNNEDGPGFEYIAPDNTDGDGVLFDLINCNTPEYNVLTENYPNTVSDPMFTIRDGFVGIGTDANAATHGFDYDVEAPVRFDLSNTNNRRAYGVFIDDYDHGVDEPVFGINTDNWREVCVGCPNYGIGSGEVWNIDSDDDLYDFRVRGRTLTYQFTMIQDATNDNVSTNTSNITGWVMTSQDNSGNAEWTDLCTALDNAGCTVSSVDLCETVNRVPRVIDVDGNMGCSNIWDNGTRTAVGGTGLPTDPATLNGGNVNIELTVFGNVLAELGSYFATSDERLKTNIVPVNNSLELLAGIQSYNYEYKSDLVDDRDVSGVSRFGFMAQELEEVVPDAVKVMPNGYYGVDYDQLIPIAVSAINEQQNLIDGLQNQINGLNASYLSNNGNTECNDYMAFNMVTPSDRDYKSNIEPVTNALAKISQLQGLYYNYNGKEHPNVLFPEGRQLGFIAQDVEGIVPEVVKTYKDGYKGIAYQNMVALLAMGINEQQTIIDNQNTLIADQQTQITDLNDRLNRLEALVNNLATGNVNTSSTPNVNTGVTATEVSFGGFSLGQNVPNPTDGATTVSFELNDAYANAFLVITDINSRTVKEYRLNGKGAGKTKLDVSSLSEGIYMYTLVVDGKTIDSKKMMVQK